MKAKILSKIQTLDPVTVEVVNFSHLHAGHSGDNGTGESHFDLCIVSNKFKNLSKVARHKLVYNCLSEEIQETIHALKIRAYTPEEFQSDRLKNSKK